MPANIFPLLKVMLKKIKKILRPWLLNLRRKYRVERHRKKYMAYGDLSAQQVFTKIYEEGAWGKSTDPEQKFFSGSGSHDNAIIGPYLEAIQKVLSSFPKKPDVVDLGCGDFYAGSRVRSLCGTYTACDIVESLINFNKEKYKSLNVDFRCLDITKDELPKGDIVFIKQVLQHLSNEQINRALPKLISKYKYLVLAEHLPALDSFTHNLEKPAGPGIRVAFDSGVVLTSPPFNLKVKGGILLCEVAQGEGVIRTNLYTLDLSAESLDMVSEDKSI
jgi:2-polyprenyl-3-methyl-5-hydroxy-6-metoxy-1,4-benzoquinol methylase